LGGSKGIGPVKTKWWGAGVVICLQRGADLHMAQLMPLPLTVSCSSKIQMVLPFRYWFTRLVLDKGPLNGCVCVISYTARIVEAVTAELPRRATENSAGSEDKYENINERNSRDNFKFINKKCKNDVTEQQL